jgi:hypothetical protein
MSKRQGLASKLCAVLGGAGLAIGICAPMAMAQASVPPPFANANYANRYVCNVTSDDNFFTAIMKINPNGKGQYTAGTLTGSGSEFFAFDPGAVPPTNFCSYSLATGTSGYAIDSHGLGTEVLGWIPASGQNAACPPGFTMNTRIVLRNSVNANNIVARTLITSGNLLGQSPFDPGYGYCFK